MRYYLGFVLFGLLMSGLCLVLEVHSAPPALVLIGLFGANAADEEAARADVDVRAALPA